MRGAGCTINDIFDRDIDVKVARTAGRLLASGAVGLTGAWPILAAQPVGLIILLQLNPLLGLGVRPGTRRFPSIYNEALTYWPQLLHRYRLQLGGGDGLGGGHRVRPPAAGRSISAASLGISGYDTIYAHQDKDRRRLDRGQIDGPAPRPQYRPYMVGFYAAALAGIAGAAWLAGLGVASFAVLYWPAATHLRQYTVDLDEPAAMPGGVQIQSPVRRPGDGRPGAG